MKELGLLILRLAIGLGLFKHGYGKVFEGGVDGIENMVTNWGWPLPGIFAWAAALSELVGGALIALGIYTRYAVVVAAATMIVGLIQVHWGADLIKGGELALLYLAGLATIMCLGPGKVSVDGVPD